MGMKVVGKRVKVMVCTDCNSLLQFDNKDLLDNCKYCKNIKCISCGKIIRTDGNWKWMWDINGTLIWEDNYES